MIQLDQTSAHMSGKPVQHPHESSPMHESLSYGFGTNWQMTKTCTRGGKDLGLVGLEEIMRSDLLQARFWTVSELPTRTKPLARRTLRVQKSDTPVES